MVDGSKCDTGSGFTLKYWTIQWPSYIFAQVLFKKQKNCGEDLPLWRTLKLLRFAYSFLLKEKETVPRSVLWIRTNFVRIRVLFLMSGRIQIRIRCRPGSGRNQIRIRPKWIFFFLESKPLLFKHVIFWNEVLLSTTGNCEAVIFSLKDKIELLKTQKLKF